MTLSFRTSANAAGSASDTDVACALTREAGELLIAWLSWVPEGNDDTIALDEEGWTLAMSGTGDGAAMAVYWRTAPAAGSVTLTATFAGAVGSPKLAILAYSRDGGRGLFVRGGDADYAGDGEANAGLVTTQPWRAGSTLLHLFRLRSVGHTIASGAGDTTTQRVSNTGIAAHEGTSDGSLATGGVVLGGTGDDQWAAALLEIWEATHLPWHPQGTFRPSRVYEDPQKKIYPVLRAA